MVKTTSMSSLRACHGNHVTTGIKKGTGSHLEDRAYYKGALTGRSRLGCSGNDSGFHWCLIHKTTGKQSKF